MKLQFIRAELAKKLSRILKEGTVIKSSHLLRAHATFITLGELSGDELLKAYHELVASNTYPKGAVLRLSRQASPDDVDNTGIASAVVNYGGARPLARAF